MPRAARKRWSLDERRSQLLALGIEAFSSAPFDAVSIDDIAARAGISKGLLYHYFETKQRFYVAALRAVAKALHAELETDPGAAPIERLREGLEKYFGFVRRYGDGYMALLHSASAIAAEAEEVLEWSRHEILTRLVQGLGVDPGSPLLRVLLRGWIGFVETSCIEWLRTKPRADQEDIIRALTDALFAVLAAAAVTIPTAETAQSSGVAVPKPTRRIPRAMRKPKGESK